MFECENCKACHDGSYASGRFCSPRCSRSFSTSKDRKEINRKTSETLRLRFGNKPKPEKVEVLQKPEKELPKSRKDVKRRALKLGLLKEECAICGRGPEWRSMRLVLVLDHINGVNNDNRIENLRLVCPNCNSQLPTFSGRNIAKKEKVEKFCLDCERAIQKWSVRCKSCSLRYRWSTQKLISL